MRYKGFALIAAALLVSALILLFSIFAFRVPISGSSISRSSSKAGAKAPSSKAEAGAGVKRRGASGGKRFTGSRTEGKAEKKAPIAEGGYQEKLDKIAKKRLRSEVERGDVGEKKVALTFDAGAAADSTPVILDILKKRGIKATFFLTGKWVEQNPALAKRIADEGHEIGNHTYSHPKLTSMTEAEVLGELTKAEEVIRRVTGEDPRPFFRAPYGARDQRVLDIVAKRGYFSVYWTVDSFDWKEGIEESEVKGRILSAISPGAIILSHAGSPVEARVLPSVLDEIEKRGYKPVKLSDVLSD